MIGWILIVTAVTLIAAIGWSMAIWRWIDCRFMTRFATQMQAQRDKANTEIVVLGKTLQNVVAERDSLKLQLEEALKPRPKAVRVKKVEKQA